MAVIEWHGPTFEAYRPLLFSIAYLMLGRAMAAEPFAEPNQESAELASSLTTAFLVLLEQLAPTERAVFLLREVFELGFDEIATSVGKSEANTRQILPRAQPTARCASALRRVTS